MLNTFTHIEYICIKRLTAETLLCLCRMRELFMGYIKFVLTMLHIVML